MKRCLVVAALAATLLLVTASSAANTTIRVYCLKNQGNTSYWTGGLPGNYVPIVQYYNPSTRQIVGSVVLATAHTTSVGQSIALSAKAKTGLIVWTVGLSGPSYAAPVWNICL